MAKSKKINLGLIITLGSIVLALVAFLLMFAPAIGIKNTDTTYSGAQVACGYSKSAEVLGSTVTTKILVVSAYFIPYLLVAAGLVFSVLSLLGKLGKISGIVAAFCYVAAGVFFFCAVPFSAPFVPEGMNGDLAAEYVKQAKEAMTLGAGAIVAGIFSLISGLASLSTLFVKRSA